MVKRPKTGGLYVLGVEQPLRGSVGLGPIKKHVHEQKVVVVCINPIKSSVLDMHEQRN